MSTRRLQLVFATLLAGCLPSFSVDNPGDPNNPSDPSNPNNPSNPANDAGVNALVDMTTPPDLAIDPVQVFNDTIAPLLTTSCAGCHNKTGGVGPGFLEPHPDILTTLLGYPGMIGPSPETSRIYAKGVHEGPGLTAVQKPIVGDWINLWARLKPKADGGTSKPTVMPFVPTMGDNTVDLSVLDPSLVGQKITFTASMIGTTLHLSKITVVTAGMGLHIAHPLWVMWDANMTPTPDPVDSFSNLDETVPSGDTMPMGPGSLFLPNFGATMMLNVVFNTIEVKTVAADGGLLLGCKNVASWTTNAKPALSSATATCTNCHAGQNASATGAFPLQTGNGDTVNCANSLGEVDLTTPANSRIFSFPDPNKGNNGHPFHFANATDFQTFQTAVTTWITAEK